MEYCLGGDLFSLYENETKGMDEEDVKFYAANIVLILEALHKKNIVHRDIKAENFLVDADGYLKLADFGNAKEEMLNGRRAYSICGTREFMAPEMLNASVLGYDFSQDWWSFGCVLYDMLCCSTPFYGMSEKVVREKILNQQPCYPVSLSNEVRHLIQNLLEKEP